MCTEVLKCEKQNNPLKEICESTYDSRKKFIPEEETCERI